MTKEQLLEARQKVSDQFDAVQEELHRLQGEYRVYSKLIEQPEEVVVDDPALTIEVNEEKSEDAPTDNPE